MFIWQMVCESVPDMVSSFSWLTCIYELKLYQLDPDVLVSPLTQAWAPGLLEPGHFLIDFHVL